MQLLQDRSRFSTEGIVHSNGISYRRLPCLLFQVQNLGRWCISRDENRNYKHIRSLPRSTITLDFGQDNTACHVRDALGTFEDINSCTSVKGSCRGNLFLGRFCFLLAIAALFAGVRRSSSSIVIVLWPYQKVCSVGLQPACKQVAIIERVLRGIVYANRGRTRQRLVGRRL